jgi:endoglucanase Acf2
VNSSNRQNTMTRLSYQNGKPSTATRFIGNSHVGTPAAIYLFVSNELTESETKMETAEIKVTIRARAFNGLLETIQCIVHHDGSVTVYDSVAGHYTTCHSLSKRDLGRARAAARKQ